MNKKILHLALSIGHTNSAYNELALPLMDKYDMCFFTYKKCEINTPDAIELVQGNNSFIRNVILLHVLIKKQQFDVIHAHNVHMVLMCVIALIGIKKNNKPKTVCTIHTSYNNYKLRNKVLFFIASILFKDIVFCSQASYDSFPKQFMNIIRKKSQVIQNGVDTKRIDKSLKLNGKNKDNKFQIAVVGRLIELKNPIMVLAAFKQAGLDNASLIFVGGGELEKKLEDKIKEYNLEDKVILKGIVERDVVYAKLAQSDLFISLSRVEGLPIAVLEAMYCECLGILSDIQPHKEINVNVKYVDIKNSESAVKKCGNLIRDYYNMSSEEREKQTQQNKVKIKKDFSVENALNKYISIYEK